MSEEVAFVLDGVRCTARRGLTILQAARANGVEIPTLCDDARLHPFGGCRLCLVDLAGEANGVVACATMVADGMQIQSHSASLRERRRAVLDFLARRMPPRPGNMPATELDRLIAAYGVEEPNSPPERAVDDAHPYIRVDMDRCIHCLRCIRICDEVQGQNTWYYHGRGSALEVRPDSDSTLRESSCVSCGACADSCPSGALFDKSVLARGAATTWTRTVCAYCGVGCELDAGARDGRLVRMRPVLDAPVNKGHLCGKGRYAFDYGTAGDRVTAPMLREGDRWRRISWSEAILFAARGLERIIQARGPEAVGVLGSARATNEDNYVAQKFARVVLGTNNVDCCARVCHAPSAAALRAMLGTGAATGCFDDIEEACTLLIVGANVTECHPVVGARIRQQGRRGANLIVIDPRRTEIAAEADIHLAPRPGTDVALLNALAAVIVEEQLVDDAFVRERVEDWEAFRDFVRSYAPERVATICGVDAAMLRATARLYAGGRPAASFHGLGLTEHVQGTAAVMCLVNLALLTGNIGKPGTGVNPLRGQNNVQGSAHMGCEPHHLTGLVHVERGRAQFEEAWGAPIPTTPGMNLMEMVAAAARGSLGALWVMGYDVALTNPNANETLAALRRLELVIIQDLFMTETARSVGTLFLPACSAFEKDGTFMNSERRIQRVRAVLPPAGDSRPDWEPLCRVAEAMGKGGLLPYDAAETIWNEVRRVWPAGAGISYARLEHAGLQWPCPNEAHPGTKRLHVDRFAAGPRAALRRIEYEPTAEQPTAELPLLLVTGRNLYAFNAGTMTGRTPHRELRAHDLLELSADDAARLGVASGDTVRVTSRYGSVQLEAAVSARCKPGEVFTTFSTAAVHVNQLTGPYRDAVTDTPEYKLTAVRIEPVRARSRGLRPGRH